MTYRVEVRRSVAKQYEAVPEPYRSQIGKALSELAAVPRPVGCVKLHGTEGWRVRVGTYRIIYKIDDGAQLVVINAIAHRRDIYR